MTRLNKIDREEIIKQILKNSFEKKWDNLCNKIFEQYKVQLVEEHPKFIELRDNPEIKSYLNLYYNDRLYLLDKDNKEYILSKPIWGDWAELIEPGKSLYGLEGQKLIREPTQQVPYSFTTVKIQDIKLLTQYKHLWKCYVEARILLISTLRAYQTREKLVNDFPKFEKYLPEIESKVTSIALIPKDIEDKLNNLNIQI